MAHEQERAVLLEPSDESHALLGEDRISHGKRFVDDQDVRIDVRDHRERKPQKHAARVGLDRLLQVFADIRKGCDRIETLVHRLPVHPEKQRIHVDIVSSRELGVEPGAEFEQRCNPAVRLDTAQCRTQGAADDLQQRRLAGPVAPDDADSGSARDLERDVPQRPEFPEVLPDLDTRPTLQSWHHELLQSICRPVIDLVALAEAANRHCEVVRRHPRTPCGSSGTRRSLPRQQPGPLLHRRTGQSSPAAAPR